MLNESAKEVTELMKELDTMKLFTGLKEYLPANLTFKTFDADYKISSEKVGPTVAKDIRRDAIIAVVFALLAIFIYIFIRFRNFTYGIGGIASLAHVLALIYTFLCYHRMHKSGQHRNYNIYIGNLFG